MAIGRHPEVDRDRAALDTVIKILFEALDVKVLRFLVKVVRGESVRHVLRAAGSLQTRRGQPMTPCVQRKQRQSAKQQPHWHVTTLEAVYVPVLNAALLAVVAVRPSVIVSDEPLVS